MKQKLLLLAISVLAASGIVFLSHFRPSRNAPSGDGIDEIEWTKESRAIKKEITEFKAATYNRDSYLLLKNEIEAMYKENRKITESEYKYLRQSLNNEYCNVLANAVEVYVKQSENTNGIQSYFSEIGKLEFLTKEYIDLKNQTIGLLKSFENSINALESTESFFSEEYVESTANSNKQNLNSILNAAIVKENIHLNTAVIAALSNLGHMEKVDKKYREFEDGKTKQVPPGQTAESLSRDGNSRSFGWYQPKFEEIVNKQ